ncbi:hypothetical protein G5714_014493 [Onychostoma macrolepis]|uniref:Uncharacterized protein n=1 Tax=Onychostoma macrolepis TaxID=369639 RepID=A0A7J6CHH6_9TELE|nr:hypothetical protein G5714_014493 [Onychostoma macrolepis]
MDFRQCQPPCSHLIVSDDQHNLWFLIVNLPFSSTVLLREASFLHEAAGWSSDAELEAMESEQFPLSLPPSPERHRVDSPIKFSRGCLAPSPEQGYNSVLVVEDTLAAHLSPTSAPSLKSCPLLPSKPCRTTSALIGKSYMAAGQAGSALHTIVILQPYQAEELKEMDEGDGVPFEAVKELRRATNLALHATKHTAQVVGRSMLGLVVAESYGDQGEGCPSLQLWLIR